MDIYIQTILWSCHFDRELGKHDLECLIEHKITKLNTDEFVTDYGEHFELSDCTRDEHIDKTISMLYIYNLNYEEICKKI